MSSPVDKWIRERAELPLPEIVKTKGGTEFDPRESHWLYRDGSVPVSLNFTSMPSMSDALDIGLRKALVWTAERFSPDTLRSRFNKFKKLVQFLYEKGEGPVTHITYDDVLAFKLSSTEGEYALGEIRAFLVKWSELGYSGIAADIRARLPKLKCKQPPIGVAVSTLDPYNGPLTDLEFEALQAALNAAYEDGTIEERALLEAYLMMSLGIRPIQLAQLKCCDLIVPDSRDGDYVLRVPRVKQSELLVRTEFKERKITTQLGEPLAAHMVSIRASFADRLDDPGEAPLFPQLDGIERANSPQLEYHASATAMTYRIIGTFKRLHVPSERLDGQLMPVTARRLRRTFATRAAEEGWPLLVIAEMLDHENTQNVKVYSGLTAKVRANFSRKIAMDMAPLAMAFTGRIIRDEAEATRPGPVSRIIDLRIDQHGTPMGNCGLAACGFLRPIACYAGCSSFEPWLDGPHEAAFDYLWARREQLLKSTDQRIASINDRAILGCAQVILRCRQILSEAAE